MENHTDMRIFSSSDVKTNLQSIDLLMIHSSKDTDDSLHKGGTTPPPQINNNVPYVSLKNNLCI